MAYQTTEELTEGEKVAFTMVTDSGVEREGEMVVTEIDGKTGAYMENGEGQKFELNFAGMTSDEICTLWTLTGKKIGDIVEMEGY